MTVKYMQITDEQEWLNKRTNYVSSTEACSLFGLGKYMSELELYHLKSSKEFSPFEENIRMKAGRHLESGIASLFSEILGCDVKPFKDYAYCDDSRMGSSFDFEITSGQYEGWILEIKNVDWIVYKNDWSESEAPDHIEVQVQHQLELTKRHGAIIGVLVGGNDPKYIVRERNEAMGAAIRNRIKERRNPTLERMLTLSLRCINRLELTR